MFTLRATGALLARWKVRPESEPPPSETVLGDWFATHVQYGRRQFLIAMSSKTLLPVVLDVVPAREIVPQLSIGLMKLLTTLGVPAAAIDAELAKMTEVTFAKTNDPRSIGSLIEFQRLHEATPESREDPNAVSRWLAHTPCRASTKDCIYPDEETLVAFGLSRDEANARLWPDRGVLH